MDPRKRETEVTWRRIFSEDTRLGRRTFLKGMGFACFGFASLLTAHRLNAGIKGSEATGREKAMSMIQESQVTNVSIPPIDVLRPAGTETATFALG